MQSRREFIKMTGLALGGVILSSCGGTTAVYNNSSVPNGFRFYRLINQGDQLPGGGTIADLPGSAMISGVDSVFFHAMDSAGAMGCYELSVDFGGITPAVTGIRKVVRDGDLLSDGRRVAKVGPGDINRDGVYASVLKLQDDEVVGLYLDSNNSGMQRVVGYQDSSPGIDGFIGQRMGDVDIHDNNDILFTAHFGNRQNNRPQVGLFHLPGGTVSSNASIVASSESLVPNADGIVKSFGLIDLNDGGNYVTQAVILTGSTAGAPKMAPGTAGRPPFATVLLTGNVSGKRPGKLIAAPSSLRVSKSVQAAVGENILGPRLGVTQNIAHVVHTSEDAMTLYYDNAAIVSTGDTSPRGQLIQSISPVVVGDDGSIYFSVFTDVGIELCIASGRLIVSILGSGDMMSHDNNRVMTRFMFGAMSTQVDAAGRITFIGDYASAGNQVGAVVVGVPI